MELTLLLWLAQYEGWLVTISIVVCTGIIGTLLARSQGFSTWQKIQSQLAAGQMPGSAMADAAMIFAAGALLMTPGLLTDGVGFAMLIPPCRAWMKTRFLSWAKSKFHIQASTTVDGETRTYRSSPGRSEVVDSYVVPDQKDHKAIEE